MSRSCIVEVQMPFCQKCGAELVGGAAFCSECGAPIVAPPISTVASPTQKEEEDKASFSGTYVLEAQGVAITLTLRQDAQGKISGSLSSISGMQFQVNGQIEEDAAVGACYDNKGGVYFEARLNGNQLLLDLIELDATNMPDYNKVRQLAFTKQGEAVSRQPLESPAVGQTVGSSAVLPNEIGDPNWGFKFQPPSGWKPQKTDKASVLGHGTIWGAILVIPHVATNLQEVQQQMLKGYAEENIYLSLISPLQPISDSVIAGDYVGIYNGQQIKARGVGTFSPFGGGAYIIALTSPEKFGQELSGTAETIAKGMQYFKVEVSPDLMQHLAGTWVNFTRDTATKMTLTSSGEYFDNFEAGHLGQFHDQQGFQTGYWGTTTQDQNKGRWTVRGNREQGQIIITFQDGRKTVLEYQVHVEKGQTYWNEYLFNGVLYGKQQ